MSPHDDQLAIEADGLGYSYPGAGRRALDSLSFRLRRGQELALLGANGSGKSTLARMLNGLLLPDEGRLAVCGVAVGPGCDLVGLRRRAALAQQNPEDQVVFSRCLDEAAFGPLNLGLPRAEAFERGRRALARVGLSGFEERSTERMSPGELQRLAVAGVLSMDCELIVLDEASAMLDPASRSCLRDIIADFKLRGGTVVSVTHRMEEALRADSCLVLSKGRAVFQGKPSELFSLPELPAWGLLRPDDQYPPLSGGARGASSGEPLFRARGVGWRYEGESRWALRSIDFELPAGTPTVLLGASGSGKTSLLNLLSGLDRPDEGALSHRGAVPSPGPVGLLFQRPEQQFFEAFAADEVAAGPKARGLAGPALVARVKGAMESAGLPYAEFGARRSSTFSGGEKRKLAVACILALESGTLVMDEPTASLDPVARRELLALIGKLAAEGREVLIATHEMDIAWGAARVLLLAEGKLAFDGAPRDLFAKGEAELSALGMEKPLALRLEGAAK